jgi:hypothetical protein
VTLYLGAPAFNFLNVTTYEQFHILVEMNIHKARIKPQIGMKFLLQIVAQVRPQTSAALTWMPEGAASLAPGKTKTYLQTNKKLYLLSNYITPPY